jgi:DNA replication and repair protein RecF
MRLVSNNRFGQTFLTDTNLQRVQNLFEDIEKELRIFNVNWDTTIDVVESKN